MTSAIILAHAFVLPNTAEVRLWPLNQQSFPSL